MYGITEKYNADRRGGQALQSLCGRLCGILHKTNERNGTEQRHCHCAVWQTDDGEWCGLSVRLWFGETEFSAKTDTALVPGTGAGDREAAEKVFSGNDIFRISDFERRDGGRLPDL